jgi:hypothetical protein
MMNNRTPRHSKITIKQALEQSSPLAIDIRALPGFTLKQVHALSPSITTSKYQYWQKMGFLTPRDGGEEAQGIDYFKLCLMVRIAEGQSLGLADGDAAEYAHSLIEDDLKQFEPSSPITESGERESMLRVAKNLRHAQAKLGGALAYLNRALSEGDDEVKA